MDGLFRFLNDDVGITILSRLPQKSLLRFRSVCNLWRNTIDSPIFRELHVENQLYNGKSINDDDRAFLRLISGDPWKLSMRLQDSQKSFDDFPKSYQDFFRNRKDYEILEFSGPVHGLICFYNIHSNTPIALCNPSLGKIKILPLITVPSFYGYRNVGLGYNDLEKDYKVVQMWFDSLQLHTVVEVYSRKKNTWRVLADHPLHRNLLIGNQIHRLRPSMRANVVHWIGIKSSTVANSILDFVIISFDMRTEALEMITIPSFLQLRNFSTVAKEDSILLFAWFNLPLYESRGVNIWEYKRDWILVGNCLRPSVKYLMSDGVVFKIFDDNMLVLFDYCTKQEIACFSFDLQSMHDRKIEYMGSFISP